MTVRAAFMVTCLGDLFYPEVGVRERTLTRGVHGPNEVHAPFVEGGLGG